MNKSTSLEITVIVLTYNSSAFIIETLNSIKEQSYKQIELVITDDCSSDNTLELCNNWILNHKHHFTNCELITTNSNTGIPANCNRGVNVAKGKWIKLIAGDDLLLNNCISDGLNFIKKNPNIQIFSSNGISFYDNWNNSVEKKKIGTWLNGETTAKDQLKLLLKGNPIIAPTVFISRKLFDMNNGFDESIPYMEDYPFWLTTLRNEIPFYHLNATTIAYRMHSNSISGFNKTTLFNKFYKKYFDFQRTHLFIDLNWIEKSKIRYNYKVCVMFDKLKLNKIQFKIFFFTLLKLNPFVVLSKIKQVK